MKIGIVLAARLEKPGEKNSRMLPRHFEHLKKGLELYKDGKVDKLVVTASHQFGFPKAGQSFYLRSVRWLAKRGVPHGDILRVRTDRWTVEEAVGARHIISQYKPREIHLVASDSYIDRAKAVFETAYPLYKVFAHEVPSGDSRETVEKKHRDIRNVRRWRRAVARQQRQKRI